jgi:hypothetical protein
MSDTKHTPKMHEDANAVFDCLKYHASAGGEYEYRGTLAIEALARICKEIVALLAATEKAREALDLIYDMADDWRAYYEKMYGEYRKEIQIRNQWKLD